MLLGSVFVIATPGASSSAALLVPSTGWAVAPERPISWCELLSRLSSTLDSCGDCVTSCFAGVASTPASMLSSFWLAGALAASEGGAIVSCVSGTVSWEYNPP